MKRRYTYIALTLLVMSSFSVSAQTYFTGKSVISPLGGSYTGTTYAGDFTIGELAISTHLGVSGDYIINEGFHAGDVIFNKLEEAESTVLRLNAYPNPVKDKLSIYLKGFDKHDIVVKMYSLSGKLIKSIPMKDALVKVDVSDLKTGIYFIHAIDKSSNTRVNTLKIQKL